jgi:hypothetical protein
MGEERNAKSEPSPGFFMKMMNISLCSSLFLYPNQKLHAIWAVNDSSGTGQEIYCAKLDVQEMTWAEPISLAIADQVTDSLAGIVIDRVGWPSVIKNANEFIVIYMVCSPYERRMRISNDAGQVWANPIDPYFPTRGEYGAADFAVDSNNVLHVIFGDRARGWSLWHSIWQNGYWAEPEPIVPPVESQIYQEDPETFASQRPHAVFSNGNVFLATWQTDHGHDHNGTWYSFKILDAPQLPLVPLPTFEETPIKNPPATPIIPDPTPTAVGILTSQSDLRSHSSDNPGSALVLGLVPVVMLISAIIIYYSFRSHKK